MCSYLISCLLLICIVWLRFVMSLRNYLGIVEINSMFRLNIDMGICTFFLIPLLPCPIFPCDVLVCFSDTVIVIDYDNGGEGTQMLINRETMLSQSPLDLILILSPSELHVPQALLCLKYKKHIFIEKPLANTLSEVDALEKARIDAGDCIVFVGYMRRYASAVDLVKKRLEEKEIKYVRVRELIGSVSFLPIRPLLLLLDEEGRT